MPSITIKEYDLTSAGGSEASDFAVVVPGLCGLATPTGFDENGVLKCETLRYFKEHAGFCAETGGSVGNRLAAELLKLGYTVLFVNIANIDWTDPASSGVTKFISALSDKSTYDFRYLISGLKVDTTKAVKHGLDKALCDIASYRNGETEKGRGDCIALLDISEVVAEGSAFDVAAVIAEANDGTYDKADKNAAFFTPAVNYKKALVTDEAYENDGLKFPASFHYLACAKQAFETYSEWYAVAGYTRGVSDKYIIESTSAIFGEAAVAALEPRTYEGTGKISKSVNVVTKIRGNYYLWGNRTAEDLIDSSLASAELKASHFLNIRQLCCTLKKVIYNACKQFTFDPNSDTLWINFCNAIKPTLDKMKADQGINEYKFIKVIDSKKAKLRAIIRIVPIEAVEDFDISIYLEDSISGTIAAEIEE